MHPVLQLDGFGVAFGERMVLHDVSVAVPGGGCTALLGPSGTGKSTLLRTLAGYNRRNPSLRSWGTALYQGRACTPQHQPALVMQNSRLLVSNVFENLVCDLPERAALTRRAQTERVEAMLQDCGFTHLLDHLDDKVVERPVLDQRAIAALRLAVASPALLMLDEPTAGLDPLQAAVMLALIRRLARRCTMLVVLHHLQQTQDVADHVVLLANGVIEESACTPVFFSQPASQAARAFLATGSCPERGCECTAETVEVMPADALAPPAAASRHTVSPPVVSAACGPRGFLWLLPGQLAGTPWPGIVHPVSYDLDALRHVGVTCLISLTESPFDAALAASHGIACHASPMPDMRAPSHPQALALCAQLDALLAAGEVVAVHCHAGLGRTGTVLAAYWLWLGRGERSAVSALEDVRRIEPGWVQSSAQVKFLEEFALVVADLPAGTAAAHDPVALLDDRVAAFIKNVPTTHKKETYPHEQS